MRSLAIGAAAVILAAVGAPVMAQDQGPPVSAVFAWSLGMDPNAAAQVETVAKALGA